MTGLLLWLVKERPAAVDIDQINDISVKTDIIKGGLKFRNHDITKIPDQKENKDKRDDYFADPGFIAPFFSYI